MSVSDRTEGMRDPFPASSAEQTTSDPRFSVVIPCYNYAAYLDGAIRSALDQEGVAVDVVVVDDASTDGSREIAESWSARDGRVRLIAHASNRGHIETFNEALAAATGEYVVKLDADDVLTRGSLRRSADLLETHPEVVFVYGGVLHASGRLPIEVPTAVTSWKLWRGDEWRDIVAHRARNPISQPEVVIRRAALQMAGGHRAEVPGTSDLHLWLRLSTLGHVAHIRGAVQGIYRVHGESMRATIHSGLLHDVRARRDAFELFGNEMSSRIRDPERFERTWRRALSRDAVTNAFLDFEADRDPRPLLDEAVALHPVITRTRAWRSLQHQLRHGTWDVWWARPGRVGRDVAQRIRSRRHRRFGL